MRLKLTRGEVTDFLQLLFQNYDYQLCDSIIRFENYIVEINHVSQYPTNVMIWRCFFVTFEYLTLNKGNSSIPLFESHKSIEKK